MGGDKMNNVEHFIKEILPTAFDKLQESTTKEDFKESDIPTFSNENEIDRKIAIAYKDTVDKDLFYAEKEAQSAKLKYRATVGLLEPLKNAVSDDAELMLIRETIQSASEDHKRANAKLEAAQIRENLVYRSFERYLKELM